MNPRENDAAVSLRNDVASIRAAMMRCLLMCRKAHIIAEGNIITVGNIICPIGQTSFKKVPFVGRQKRLFCCDS